METALPLTRHSPLQEEEYHHLSCQDAEEHGQWVNGGICHGSAVVDRGLGGGIRQCGRVGGAACYQAHEGEIVEFEPQAPYECGNQKR